MTEHLPTNDCSNCGDFVVQRRPSSTGKHWCKRPACQAAKQRDYRARARAAETPRGQIVDRLKLALFTALVEERYLTDGCPDCGQAPALEGWVHPTPGWGRVCEGTGLHGNEPELGDYWKALYPEGCPF